MNDAVPTLAPSSRADNATSGRIAPWPMATRTVGPYAVIAMSRQRVGSALIQRAGARLVAAPIPHASEPTQVGGELDRTGPGFRLVRSFDHWTRHVPVQCPTVAEFYAAGDCLSGSAWRCTSFHWPFSRR